MYQSMTQFIFFFFLHIGSKMVLRLFLFLYPHSPTLLHTEKHTMPEHSAQPEAVWQHSITTKPHPNKKKKTPPKKTNKKPHTTKNIPTAQQTPVN